MLPSLHNLQQAEKEPCFRSEDEEIRETLASGTGPADAEFDEPPQRLGGPMNPICTQLGIPDNRAFADFFSPTLDEHVLKTIVIEPN